MTKTALQHLKTERRKILMLVDGESLKAQLRYLPGIALAIALPAVFLAAAVFQTAIPLETFTREPVIVAINTEDCCFILSGAISNLGAIMWIAGAAVFLFSGILLHSLQDKRSAAFIGFMGVIALLFGLDDIFLIHDEILPWFGAPEKAVLLAYLCMLGAHTIIFAADILDNRYIALAIAYGLFGVALAEDVFKFTGSGDLHFFLEDGLRVVGLGAWLYFFLHASWRYIKDNYAAAAR